MDGETFGAVTFIAAAFVFFVWMGFLLIKDYLDGDE